MVRNDNSNYFLYMEPRASEKTDAPVLDIYTEAVEYFFNKSVSGIAPYSNHNSDGTDFRKGQNWRGFHRTNCGEWSTSNDYLLADLFITDSLCVFYVKFYRNSITGEDLRRLELIKDMYESHKNK